MIIRINVWLEGVSLMLNIPVAKPTGRKTTVTYVNRRISSAPRSSKSPRILSRFVERDALNEVMLT